jgi:peptide chain release factor 1
MFENKLRQLMERLAIVEEELSQPDTVKNKKKFKELSQEHSNLNELKSVSESYEKSSKELLESQELLKMESDPEFSAILKDEIATLEKLQGQYASKIENLLVPPDPADSANTIIEIRAGTGGEEAALFVADCSRMYKLFAEKMGWKWEVLNFTDSEMGGYKDVVMVLSGQNVHRFMQYEGGTHRVQRVPDTETQGRVHTSAVTIAILLEPGEDDPIEIDEKEIRMDTMRSSGAGGQHVNKTDSAVRLTHLPSGIVVGCQEERSQHKNRDKAMRILKAKLKERQDEKKRAELSLERKEQVGTGDRSERIRTYNFSQNRLTDHRVNFTSHNLDRVMEGELEEITSELVKFYYQKKF